MRSIDFAVHAVSKFQEHIGVIKVVAAGSFNPQIMASPGAIRLFKAHRFKVGNKE
jgi:hypothetical protein